MKKNILALLAVSLVLVTAGTIIRAEKKFLPVALKETDTAQHYTVVELFTSEGCSSCPSADKVLAGLAASYKNKIIVLGFHVDYWNSLGWKDRFSDAAYSQRQQQYANANRSEQVYTPQAVIDGGDQMVGSDEAKLLKSIQKNNSPSNTPIQITATEQKEKHSLQVDYSFEPGNDKILNIALLQTDAVTQVAAGENKGLTLHHVNVVRDFKTVSDANGTVALKIPDHIAGKDCSIVGYVQEKKSMKIIGSTGYIIVH